MTKQKFYETIERCLSLDPSINSHAINDEAVTKLKNSFLETIARDKSNERDLLLRLSSIFRGRIRWSVLFVEYLFMAYLESIDIPEAGRINTKDLIEQVSGTVRDMIIEQLWDRIEELKRKKKHFLLRDLYITAVRSDLMGMPCIFPDLESSQMVTEGFALVKTSGKTSDPGSLKQELAEPIVVQAVIKYLRENEGKPGEMNRHDRILEQLLFDHQQDPSLIPFAVKTLLFTLAGVRQGISLVRRITRQ